MNAWRTACPDWETRIRTGASLVPRLPLFDPEAARALRIFKRLRIPDMAGLPTMAMMCGPWFLDIVAALFGSYDAEANRRMIQEYFLMIPKGNSKSSYGGPLMLTAVIVNRRPEAGFSFIAPTMRVADIAFTQAGGTIRADPELEKLFQIQSHIRTITHRTTGAQLKIKAADTDVVTGGKDVGTMIDETHVFAKKSNASDIFVELRGALAKRTDGFLFQTTTQSKDPPTGVFRTELANARAVRDGELDLPMLPILYEYPDDMIEADAWRDRKTWHMVNPNLGRSVDPIFLQQQVDKATGPNGTPEELMLLASQHFNVEIGLRMHANTWKGAKYWEGAGDKSLTLDALLERSEVAVIGIDGGGLDDLFGLAVAGRDKVSKKWLYWAHAWAQRDVLLLRKEVASSLIQFEGQGDLTLCDDGVSLEATTEDAVADDNAAQAEQLGDSQDIRGIIEIVRRVQAMGLLPEKSAIGLDPQGVGALVDALASLNLVHPQMVGVTQGFRLSSAVWSMERKLKHGMLVHDGSDMMAWCVGNAKAEQKGNAVLITKETAGKAKIDPLIAMFNATKLLELNPVAAANDGVDAWFDSMRA